MDGEVDSNTKKAHRKRQAGSKADKKKKKSPIEENVSAKQRNPKAFAFQSVNKVARQVRR
jgi:ribosome biogenesis protein BMS1